MTVKEASMLGALDASPCASGGLACVTLAQLGARGLPGARLHQLG